MHMVEERISSQKCSCCGKPLKIRSSSYPKGKNGGMYSHAPTPSPRAHPYNKISDSEGTSDVDLFHDAKCEYETSTCEF